MANIKAWKPRLVKSSPPRPLAPLSHWHHPPRSTRPPPEPVPLLVRTTRHWHPSSPRGQRIELREVATPGDALLSSSLLSSSFGQEESYSQSLRRELGLEDGGPLPLTPWRKLHARPDAQSTSSEYSDVVPTTSKARARRLAAIACYMPTSRAHRHNAALSMLATAN